ncbi:hypothetical protein AKJ09_10709 [Labilithrix luteola]|uniref:Uncharacterized protein n=1 Tax=Labilithrix luteola TaxID=1391654 RepID=A0A0K1QE50_9BACT|nr:hypothetical protein AKJ09_10709 [Labilithrix luteola]
MCTHGRRVSRRARTKHAQIPCGLRHRRLLRQDNASRPARVTRPCPCGWASLLLRRPLAWTEDLGTHGRRGSRDPRSFAQVCRELRLTIQSAQLSCAVSS